MSKPYNGRDHLMLKVIGGATKAGIQPDRKKEENKNLSRRTRMNQPSRPAQENKAMFEELKYLKREIVALTQRLTVVSIREAELLVENAELRGQLNLKEMLDPTTEENKELAAEAELVKTNKIEMLRDVLADTVQALECKVDGPLNNHWCPQCDDYVDRNSVASDRAKAVLKETE